MAIRLFEEFIIEESDFRPVGPSKLTQTYRRYLLWLITKNKPTATSSELLTQLALINTWVNKELAKEPQSSHSAPDTQQGNSLINRLDLGDILLTSVLMIEIGTIFLLGFTLGPEFLIAGAVASAIAGIFICFDLWGATNRAPSSPAAPDEPHTPLLSEEGTDNNPSPELQSLITYTRAPMLSMHASSSPSSSKTVDDEVEVDLQDLSGKLSALSPRV